MKEWLYYCRVIRTFVRGIYRIIQLKKCLDYDNRILCFVVPKKRETFTAE